VLVALNTAETPAYREQFHVAGLPTVVLAKPGGEEVDRTFGYLPTGEFIPAIEGYEKGIGTLAAMLGEEEKKSDDPEFLTELGEKLYAHSRFEDADERYAGVIKIDSANSAGMADDAQIMRARLSAKLENYPLAIAFCEALIKRWPTSELVPDATIYTAYYSDKAGRTDDAVKTYKQYLDKWPKGEDAEWATEQIKKLTAPPAEE